jgi:hypothetical protein
MKHYRDRDTDREKKIHKVQKSNKVAKHRKNIYDYHSEDDSDDDIEYDLYEVEEEQ